MSSVNALMDKNNQAVGQTQALQTSNELAAQNIAQTQSTQELLSEQAIVTPASTVASAREKLNANPYDLVVLDLKLPDGMGTDLLPCLNCKTKNPIPVIVFSAYELQNKFAPLIRQAILSTRVPNDELLSILCSVLNKKLNKKTE